MKRLIISIILILPVSFCLAGDLYVWTNSPSENFPYNSWSNASHTIQAAVNAASSNDTVHVTNGVYNVGGITGHMSLKVIFCRFLVFGPIYLLQITQKFFLIFRSYIA